MEDTPPRTIPIWIGDLDYTPTEGECDAYDAGWEDCLAWMRDALSTPIGRAELIRDATQHLTDYEGYFFEESWKSEPTVLDELQLDNDDSDDEGGPVAPSPTLNADTNGAFGGMTDEGGD